jgi:hypothetical protein
MEKAANGDRHKAPSHRSERDLDTIINGQPRAPDGHAQGRRGDGCRAAHVAVARGGLHRPTVHGGVGQTFLQFLVLCSRAAAHQLSTAQPVWAVTNLTPPGVSNPRRAFGRRHRLLTNSLYGPCNQSLRREVHAPGGLGVGGAGGGDERGGAGAAALLLGGDARTLGCGPGETATGPQIATPYAV